jgi:choline-glycine betaine transporter
MHRFIKAFALSLSLAISLMMGSMQLNIGSHSVEHQHHSAKTHTTGICAWMCAAAQSITSDSQVISPHVALLDILKSLPFSSHSSLPQTFLPSRAPPY